MVSKKNPKILNLEHVYSTLHRNYGIAKLKKINIFKKCACAIP